MNQRGADWKGAQEVFDNASSIRKEHALYHHGYPR
jgi:hypothetical protein